MLIISRAAVSFGKGMIVSVDKYTTVKMYDKVQHYWAIEKQKIMQERNSAATKEQRDELTRILNYMNRVEMAVIVSEEADENEKFQKQGSTFPCTGRR